MNDTNAWGVFVSMTMDTTWVQTMLVSFTIRDGFDIVCGLSIEIPHSSVCGGSKSKLWKDIVTNVLSIPRDIVTV